MENKDNNTKPDKNNTRQNNTLHKFHEKKRNYNSSYACCNSDLYRLFT